MDFMLPMPVSGVWLSSLVKVGGGLIESEHAENVPANLLGTWMGAGGPRLNGFGGQLRSGGSGYSPKPAQSGGSVARGILPTRGFVAGVGGVDGSASEGDRGLNGLLDLNMASGIRVLFLYVFEDSYEGLAQPIPYFFHVVLDPNSE